MRQRLVRRDVGDVPQIIVSAFAVDDKDEKDTLYGLFDRLSELGFLFCSTPSLDSARLETCVSSFE